MVVPGWMCASAEVLYWHRRVKYVPGAECEPPVCIRGMTWLWRCLAGLPVACGLPCLQLHTPCGRSPITDAVL